MIYFIIFALMACGIWCLGEKLIPLIDQKIQEWDKHVDEKLRK